MLPTSKEELDALLAKAYDEGRKEGLKEAQGIFNQYRKFDEERAALFRTKLNEALEKCSKQARELEVLRYEYIYRKKMQPRHPLSCAMQFKTIKY